MGAVVDPAAENDAVDSDDRSSMPGAASGGLPTPSPTPELEGVSPIPNQRTGHPVRDRLLAKAQAAAELAQNRAPDLMTDAFSSLKEVERELEQIAVPERAATFQSLSPTAVLATGTLIGAAAIASLFALLVHFAPRSAGPASLEPAKQTDAKSIPLNPNPVELAPEAARPKTDGPYRVSHAGPGQKLVKGNVGRAAFLNALQTAGLTKPQAYEVFNALKDVTDLDHCKPSSEFRVLVDTRDGSVAAAEYIVNKEDVYQARASNGGLVGKALDLKVDKHRLEGALTMSGDTFASALSGTKFDASLSRVINRALDGHTSVEQFRPGDRLRIVAQEVTVLGEFARYSGIEALEYVPLTGSPIRVYYHPAKHKYYDAKGRSPGESGWRKPIKGAPITSKFNPNRMHPILKKRMPHQGTDFGAPSGTPIHAASFGIINKLGPFGPNGNFIGITHTKGFETGYSHLSRFEPGLKVGDKVESLQVIGYVGSTGRSTGPHLHFSAKKDGVFIDAESLHLDALVVLPVSERPAFEEVRRSYDHLLDAIPMPQALPIAPPALTASPEQDLETGGETPSGNPASGNPASGNPASGNPGEPSQPQLPAGALAPAAPATGPKVVVPSAPQKGSLYLSDKELMQNQGATDDGEVDE